MDVSNYSITPLINIEILFVFFNFLVKNRDGLVGGSDEEDDFEDWDWQCVKSGFTMNNTHTYW